MEAIQKLSVMISMELVESDASETLLGTGDEVIGAEAIFILTSKSAGEGDL